MEIFQPVGVFQLLIMVVIAVLVVVAIVVVTWVLFASQRTKHLRSKFGPEYDYTAHQLGDRRRAESGLVDGERRVNYFPVRSLTREEVDRFADRWQRIQACFVDEPAEAIADAEVLVREVVETRGYPMTDFEQQVTYLTVDHPEAAQNYRAACEVMQKDGHQEANQEATTEKLRQAMDYYRELFNDLLETKVQERFQRQRTTNRPA